MSHVKDRCKLKNAFRICLLYTINNIVASRDYYDKFIQNFASHLFLDESYKVTQNTVNIQHKLYKSPSSCNRSVICIVGSTHRTLRGASLIVIARGCFV